MLRDLMFGHHSYMRDIVRWSARHRIFNESNAEHTFNALVYTEGICDYLNQLARKACCGKKGAEYKYPVVNTLRAMRIMLHHDIDETVTGDVMRGAKNADPRLRKVYHDWAEAVCRIKLPEWVFKVWLAQFDGTPEAQVVQLADWVSGLQYMATEAMLGNRWLTTVAENVINDIKNMRKELPICKPLMGEVEELTYNILAEISDGKIQKPEG